MVDVTRWVNMAVALESALGSDKTISGITRADPGVVTSAGHGLADGNYVKYTITQGMSKLNGRVLRIDNKTTDTWEIEGVNTTNYTAFVAGKANLVTFGTEFQTLLDISPSGGDQQFINFRILHEDQERQIPSYRSPQVYTMRSLWDPADAALLQAEEDADNAVERALKLTFSNGKIYVVNGYVGFAFQPQGSAGELVECTITISGQGRGKAYAS